MPNSKDHIWPGFSTVVGMLQAKHSVRCLMKCDDCSLTWSEMALLGRGAEQVAMVSVEGSTPCDTKHAYICAKCLAIRKGGAANQSNQPAHELPSIETIPEEERTEAMLMHFDVFEEIKPQAEEYASHEDFVAARAKWLQRFHDTKPRKKAT